jgi:dUTP pyrophosphatase
MRIKALYSKFIVPTKGTKGAGAFDIYMPEAGVADQCKRFFGLGFSSAVPKDHVALILPRSSTGAKFNLELNNTCGVIDSDYRGEWMAALRTKEGTYEWKAGDRVLQFILVPVLNTELEVVNDLDSTERGSGGFGSSGN